MGHVMSWTNSMAERHMKFHSEMYCSKKSIQDQRPFPIKKIHLAKDLVWDLYELTDRSVLEAYGQSVSGKV